jgi:hypothetical protein
MPENPQQSRRHFHRGRRGPERRGGDRRLPNTPDQINRDQVDVEQVMRDIRSRISQRQGVELSNQQIQELAARRLETILDPRHVKPALLEQLRKSASEPVDVAVDPEAAYSFEDTTLYDTHRGVLRFIRRLLNPILKLFFNPAPLVHALNTQARLNTEAAAREAERERRQTEWNALHYELLQRVVTEVSRIAIDTQALSMRIESLAAKVEFNERRVRSIENAMHQGRVPQRPAPVEGAAVSPAGRPAESTGESPVIESGGEAPRRRRRRRRGRRSGGPGAPDVTVAADASVAANDVDDAEGDEGADDESSEPLTTEGESVVAFEPKETAPAIQSHEPPAPVPPETKAETPAVRPDHTDPGPADR